MQHPRSFYFVNALTLYRFIMAPVLVLLAVNGQSVSFKWLLAASFFTDAIDGMLSRSFRVTSIFGSRLDSIGDDMTIVAAMAGMFAFKMEFIKQEYEILAVLAGLFLIQLILAVIRYRRPTSFHTYLAKSAAVMQGVFFLTSFFFDEPSYLLFYTAVIITMLDLVEEIILVLMLKNWRVNVKGLFWMIREKRSHGA